MKPAWNIRFAILLLGTLTPLGISSVSNAQDADQFFHHNCAMCHTIGGGHLIGPDLEGVTKRKDRAWLVRFLQNPSEMIDSGDPYAAQLKQDAHAIVMPTIAGMTPALANSLLDLTEEGAGGAKAVPASPAISEAPFTPADVIAGKQLFLGERRLANGGPACVSCHTLGTLSALSGGRLGPDLTNVLARLGGRQGLSAWLSSPPTSTMQAVFGKHPLQPDEIFSLLAALDDANASSRPADRSATLKFFALGFTGMLAGLAFLQFAWRGRLRSVRRPMVHARVRGGQ